MTRKLSLCLACGILLFSMSGVDASAGEVVYTLTGIVGRIQGTADPWGLGTQRACRVEVVVDEHSQDSDPSQFIAEFEASAMTLWIEGLGTLETQSPGRLWLSDGATDDNVWVRDGQVAFAGVANSLNISILIPKTTFALSQPAIPPLFDTTNAVAVIGTNNGPNYSFLTGPDDTVTAVLTASTPEELLMELIEYVSDLNLAHGIENSLDSKLQNALDALLAANAGDREDAVRKLEAFINAVEAQAGNQINEVDAAFLIAVAEEIIALL